VKEFERRLRVSDLVIKFLTVRIDETLKRLEKRKKDRDKRAHRKSTAAPAVAQPSVAQQMMGEGAPAPAMPGLPKEAPKEA
jgi:small subunit ribosomal protein S6